MPSTVEAPTNMLLTDLLDREYAPLRMLRPKARIQYDLTLRRLAEHLGREPETGDLTGLTVQAFLAARRAKVSAGTAVNAASTRSSAALSKHNRSRPRRRR